MPTNGSDSALLELGQQFLALQAALRPQPVDRTETPLLHPKTRKHLAPILQEQYALAHASLALPATSLEELRVKAEILREYADPEPDDIVGLLIQDLCRNLLRLEGRAKECAS